jgi:hypothetical protein
MFRMSLMKDANRAEFKERGRVPEETQQGSTIGGLYEIVDFARRRRDEAGRLARDLGGQPFALAEMIDSFRTDTARIAAARSAVCIRLRAGAGRRISPLARGTPIATVAEI